MEGIKVMQNVLENLTNRLFNKMLLIMYTGSYETCKNLTSFCNILHNRMFDYDKIMDAFKGFILALKLINMCNWDIKVRKTWSSEICTHVYAIF